MTHLFNITLDLVDITDKHSTCDISEEINRFYDVANIVVSDDVNVILEKDVVINYGDKTFSGFVYTTSKLAKGMIRIECRTYSAKLTEPYSPHEVTFDDATTSHELCALYALESGIPITITAVDIDFGGSYARNGTMLSALTTIANVTGAEFYDNGAGITIEPNKAITVTGVEIPDSDIFDFVPTTKSVYNKGVGYVTIQNGGDVATDIISTNNVYAEIDECTGEIWVFPNPFGLLEHTVGIGELIATNLERKEENSLLDVDVVRLDGAIDSIKEVTLNGVVITDYLFEAGHNIIYFNTLQRGTLSVTYIAKGYRGYSNIQVTPLGRFLSLDVFYLDQKLSFQGFLSPDCLNVGTDGDMTCIIPDDTHYVKGFYLWTIGGSPVFTFYNNNVPLGRPVVSVAKNYLSVENVTLEETITGYRYRLRYPLVSVVGMRSAGVTVAYTTGTDADGDYVEFTQYYPLLVVSYYTAGTQHWIQFPSIEGSVISMTIRNDNTGEVCEYELDGINNDDLSSIPCVLNQDVPVNLAQELQLDVTDIYGVSITYNLPDATSSSAVIDEFGIIKIFVSTDGDYILDTSYIKNRSIVVLTANVNG